MRAPADRMLTLRPRELVMRFDRLDDPEKAPGVRGVLSTPAKLTQSDLDRIRWFMANEPNLIDGQTLRI